MRQPIRSSPVAKLRFSRGDRDFLLHRPEIGLGRGPARLHASLDDLLGIVGGRGEEEVGQRVAQAAREDGPADQSKQTEPSIGGDEHIARVRVGMEEAGDKDLVQQRRGPVVANARALLGVISACSPAAVDAFHDKASRRW